MSKSNRVKSRPSTKRISKLNIEKDKKEAKEKRKADAGPNFWQRFKMGIVFAIVRICSGIWAYMYHDWQAIPLLLFITHSFIYKEKKPFFLCLKFLYCPYVAAYMLWLFVVNIPKVWDF